jgi:hypothetical protein
MRRVSILVGLKLFAHKHLLTLNVHNQHGEPGSPPVGGFRSVFAFGDQGKTTTGTTPFKAPYFKNKKEGTY